MENKTIDGYELLQSLKLAGVSYHVGANADKTFPYMTCESRNRGGLAEEYADFEHFALYADAMIDFAERVRDQAELVKAEQDKRDVPLQTFTAADCEVGGLDASLVGRVAVISPNALACEYRDAAFQLVLVTGGFGAEPHARGRAVYCTELYSGENCQYSRQNIAGVMSDDKLPDWAKGKLANIRQAEQKIKKSHQQEER